MEELEVEALPASLLPIVNLCEMSEPAVMFAFVSHVGVISRDVGLQLLHRLRVGVIEHQRAADIKDLAQVVEVDKCPVEPVVAVDESELSLGAIAKQSRQRDIGIELERFGKIPKSEPVQLAMRDAGVDPELERIDRGKLSLAVGF